MGEYMERIVDLTHQIDSTIPVFPEDMPVQLTKIKTLESDGYTNYRIEISMHAGTHIDGPMHLSKKDIFISQIPCECFIGRGRVIDARGESLITCRDEYTEGIEEGDIVLFYTGHDSLFGKETYYTEYPVLDEQFAQYLINKKIKMVGFDSPSPDRHPYTIHKMLLANNIYIIENLTNVHTLLSVARCEVIALPIPIQADSSFARVIALIR